MPGTYYDTSDNFCCSVSAFTPLTTTDTPTVTNHTFTCDCGTNGDADYASAAVQYTDLGSNSGSVAAGGTYPNLTADITYPAAGTYYITVVITFSGTDETTTIRLDDPVIVS